MRKVDKEMLMISLERYIDAKIDLALSDSGVTIYQPKMRGAIIGDMMDAEKRLNEMFNILVTNDPPKR